MQRRSFFGLLFGGLLARWLPPPKQIRFHGAAIPMQQYWPVKPEYRFGFTGFKPYGPRLRKLAQFRPPSRIARRI